MHPIYHVLAALIVIIMLAAFIVNVLWGSGYTFGKGALYVNLGPFVKKIPYETILKMRSDEGRTALAMYYAACLPAQGEQAEAAVKGEMIRIKREQYDEFARQVTKRAGRAEYEIVRKEEEE